VSVRLTGPSGKARKTLVTKTAYWVPWAEGWRFLPVGPTHNQMVTDVDEDGNELRPVDLYTAKGYVPVEHVHDEAALAKLPVNWRDVCMKGAKPEYREPEPEKALATSGLGA
jgi:hypothetical protein